MGSNVGTSTDTTADLGVEHVALGVEVETSAGKGVQWFADGIGTRDASTVLDVGVLARPLEELELRRFFEGQRFDSGGCGLEVQRAEKTSDLRGTFREHLGRDAIRSACGRGPEGQATLLGVEQRGQVLEELIKTRSGTASSDEGDGGRVVTNMCQFDIGHVLLPSFSMFLVSVANGPIFENQHGHGFELATRVEPGGNLTSDPPTFG